MICVLFEIYDVDVLACRPCLVLTNISSVSFLCFKIKSIDELVSVSTSTLSRVTYTNDP